ncbi:MAG: family 43 glycosylhydrolase [Acidobacteriia bacterium]|nr:family 43 glycosylhydrolase [Terriglobia bacterium]
MAAATAPELYKLAGDISGVHDPAIAKEGDTYYIFATRGSIRRSTDLHHWTLCGRVFDQMPAWTTEEIAGSRGGYWAPDISFYKGAWRLYYSVSTFGKNDSAIGLATNKTLNPDRPDYQWVDQGMVFRSHRGDDFNAIDPNLATDAQGRQWLNFGSFWGGIKMRRIDPETGKLLAEDTKLYSLASRPRSPVPDRPGEPPSSPAIEAPFIVRHDSFYYLFVSFDFCCRGVKSTYHMVVGRSRDITGSYVDAVGKPMLEGGGTRLIQGTSLWRGPGHEGLLIEPGGPGLMVFHAYDGSTGLPSLQISTMQWERGWPRIASLPGDPIQ